MSEPQNNSSERRETPAQNGAPPAESLGMTPAPLSSRLAASLIDIFLLFTINAGCLLLPPVIGWHFASFEPKVILLGLALLLPVLTLFPLLLSLLYYTILHAFGGQTVGKIFLGIRVVSRENESLSLGGSFLLWCANFLSIFTLGLGYLWALVDPARATLHDRIAACRVVQI